MEFKAGVPRNTLDYHMRPVLDIVDEIWAAHGYKAVATSTTDGVHSAKSLHYYGLAVDIRSRDIDVKDKPEMLKKLSFALLQLSHRYQVIDEPDHIHVEWDPFVPMTVDVGDHIDDRITFQALTVKAPAEFTHV